MAKHTKPTALKLLKGDDKVHPERINKKEPKPSGPLGNPPSNFTAAEKRIWKQAPHWVAKEDRLVWISFCRLRAEADALWAACKKAKRIVRGGNGQEKINPLYSLFFQIEDRANKLAALFGMEPSDRTKIQVETEAEEDEFDKMLDV
jgi:phage terminase small subunit